MASKRHVWCGAYCGRRIKFLAVIIVCVTTLWAMCTALAIEWVSTNVTERAEKVAAQEVPATSHGLFKPRTEPLVKHQRYHDEDDPLSPRDGEHYITFRSYLDCLAQRLNVDRHRREELPFTNLTTTIPYLLVIATVELRDVKALMCNIDVPVRRLMYVQNGPVGSVTRFFDDVQRAFSFTSRLKIVRYENNIGFAGAVNTGMRDAMQYSFDEVPFFHLTNNDVRFPPGLFANGLPQFYEVTHSDKAMMEKLAAEVATEPNSFTPEHLRSPLVRSTSTDTLLVTSRLLPDRIRYMPPIEIEDAFSNHTGALFLGKRATTSSWSMSRLAMETVGFMDENFYPAYYEDTDWRWRQTALGFRIFHAIGNYSKMIHFRHVARAHASNVADRESVLYSLTLKTMIRRTKQGYVTVKWMTSHPRPLRHGSHAVLPLDAWVWNDPLHTEIATAMRDIYALLLKHGNTTTPAVNQRMRRTSSRLAALWSRKVPWKSVVELLRRPV